MRINTLAVALISLALPTAGFADSLARKAGKTAGEFGAGVAQSITAMQPQWITIPPRAKADCLAESGGVVNPVYVRCRNGRQEYVRYDANGNKIVLNERDIPLR